MSNVIRIHETGGPEVLKWEVIDPGEPAPTQLRLRQTDIGVNFVDISQRLGRFPVPLPFTPGVDGAGIVESVGSAVTRFKPGDRVVYSGGLGGYAEVRLLEERQAIAVPDDIPNRMAVGSLLRGLVVDFLLRRAYPVKAGETVLIHAAAGGVGLIFCQWAAALGAEVVGTVSTEEKADLARKYGCRHVVLAHENLPARVLEITNGKKVPVVYDANGRDTFEQSLQCLQPLGLLVSFGNASGPVPPLDIARLAPMGSLKVTRIAANTHTTDLERYRAVAQELFAMIRKGQLRPLVNVWPFAEAAAAQIALEARKTMGSTVLSV